MTEIPEGYWGTAPYYYFRDHDCMGWGVRLALRPATIVTELDKSVAAAIACLLNGDVAYAREYLDGLPEKMP